MQRQENNILCTWKPKEVGVYILILDEINFQSKSGARDEEGHYIMIWVNSTSRYNNCKYITIQHQST